MGQILIYGFKYRCCFCGEKKIVAYQPYISSDNPEDDKRIDNGKVCGKCGFCNVEELKRYTEPIIWMTEANGEPTFLINKDIVDENEDAIFEILMG